jgi:hypothetical protein
MGYKMTAFYLTSTSQDTLLSMLVTMQGNQPVLAFANVIGPMPAIPAIAAGTDSNGNPTPAIAAKGVAGNYYMSILLPDAETLPTALPSGVTEDDVNGIAVLGVWA